MTQDCVYTISLFVERAVTAEISRPNSSPHLSNRQVIRQ